MYKTLKKWFKRGILGLSLLAFPFIVGCKSVDVSEFRPEKDGQSVSQLESKFDKEKKIILSYLEDSYENKYSGSESSSTTNTIYERESPSSTMVFSEMGSRIKKKTTRINGKFIEPDADNSLEDELNDENLMIDKVYDKEDISKIKKGIYTLFDIEKLSSYWSKKLIDAWKKDGKKMFPARDEYRMITILNNIEKFVAFSPSLCEQLGFESNEKAKEILDKSVSVKVGEHSRKYKNYVPVIFVEEDGDEYRTYISKLILDELEEFKTGKFDERIPKERIDLAKASLKELKEKKAEWFKRMGKRERDDYYEKYKEYPEDTMKRLGYEK